MCDFKRACARQRPDIPAPMMRMGLLVVMIGDDRIVEWCWDREFVWSSFGVLEIVKC